MTCNFTSLSIVFVSCQLGCSEGDNERLCAVEPRLRLRGFRFQKANLGPLVPLELLLRLKKLFQRH